MEYTSNSVLNYRCYPLRNSRKIKLFIYTMAIPDFYKVNEAPVASFLFFIFGKQIGQYHVPWGGSDSPTQS